MGRVSYLGAILAWVDRGFDRRSPYSLVVLLAGPWLVGFATNEFLLPDPWPSLTSWVWAISATGAATYFLYRNLRSMLQVRNSEAESAESHEG